MENNVDQLLARFNDTIDEWIVSVKSYSLETLHKKPTADTWSLGQVYVHIISDTTYFIEQMREAIETSDNANELKHPDAQAMFDMNSFPDLQINGAATNANTRQPASTIELSEHLDFIKAEVNDLFNEFDKSMSKGKTKHPGLEYFTALEWLQFAEMHMRHHLRQKSRIETALQSLK